MEDSREVNYEEGKVPAYTLPSLLDQTRTAYEWVNERRPNLKKLLENELFGKLPPRPAELSFELLESSDRALNGTAVRKQIRIHCGNQGKHFSFDLLVYLPKNRTAPVPVFTGLNFGGNHASSFEPEVRIPEFWVRENSAHHTEKNRATEGGRGAEHDRWLPELFVSRGYALATVCYCSIYPDHPEGVTESIYTLFHDKETLQNGIADGLFPSISAWSWGLSRVMDYIEHDPDLDASKVCLCGHSRLGKTSLWSGACDPRFRIVISNNSGCGGAALSLRCFGETFGSMIQNNILFWFSPNLRKYLWHSAEQPFDQHMLLALIAPRPLYVASASDDSWADPKGEFLALAAARPVYQLFGSSGIGTDVWPEIEHPLTGDCGYHIRRGKHGIMEYDILHYLDFMDLHFGRVR